MTAPTGFTYQWKRGNASITGATAASYTPVSADVGTLLSCSVTGVNPAGTDTVASAASSTVTTGGASTATWSEEFAALDLITSTNTGGQWAADGNNLSNLTGYKDPAGVGWNANPSQNFGGSVGVLNPFTISVVTDSLGNASGGNCVTIVCQQVVSGSAIDTAIKGANGGNSCPRWGGTLVQNSDIHHFTVGCYLEWRALFTGTGSTMWPALWWYGASGVTGGLINAPGFQGAEIDIVEPQHSLSGVVSFHMDENAPPNYDIGNPSYQVNGSSDLDAVYIYPITANVWATYGMDWQTNALTFYKNGTMVYQETNATVLSYYNQAILCARLNYTVFAGTDTGTNPFTMSVDYLRQWANFAASQ